MGKQKRSKPARVQAQPETETSQEKDDRVQMIRELTMLTTAVVQLLVQVITLIIILIKDK